MDFDNAGLIVPRGLSIKNFRHAASLVEFEAGLISQKVQSYKAVYPYPTTSVDRDIYAGEILFELIGNGMPRSRTQQAFARSCLNGLLSSKQDAVEQRADLKANMRILGISLKNCTWNAEVPSHTDDPVGVVSGLMTIRNTGLHNIYPGDLILARLPDLSRSAQLPMDNFTPMSDGRRVLETVPFRVFGSGSSDTDADGAYPTLFDNAEVAQIVRSKKFKNLLSVLIPMIAMFVKETEKEEAKITPDDRKGKTDEQVAEMRIQRAAETMRKDLEFGTRKGVVAKNVFKADPSGGKVSSTEIFETGEVVAKHFTRMLLGTEPENMQMPSGLANLIVDCLVPISAAMFTSVGSQVIGVAQTASEKERNFDIQVSPSIATLLTRTWS